MRLADGSAPAAGIDARRPSIPTDSLRRSDLPAGPSAFRSAWHWSMPAPMGA